MIPVYQTMTVANDGQGNCFNACIASILELPLSQVASIHPKSEPYWSAWGEWLAERGLKFSFFSPAHPPRGYSIVTGKSSRKYPEDHNKAGKLIDHGCVAFNGEMVHDPFPLPGLFSDISGYISIVPLEQQVAA